MKQSGKQQKIPSPLGHITVMVSVNHEVNNIVFIQQLKLLFKGLMSKEASTVVCAACGRTAATTWRQNGNTGASQRRCSIAKLLELLRITR
jgi:hypothetical protein